jgi:amino acid adenylation domain-containing protein
MSSVTFDPFAGGELLRVSPTTWPQKEVIASAQISDEANTAFNEAVSISIEGHLDIELLELCFGKLVERHDILRATFSRKGNEICLHQSRPFKLGYEDLRLMQAEAQKKEIGNLWRNIAISPMNLEEGPLFFAWIKQLKDASFELIIAAHHIICDGWSIGLLLNELTAIYRNKGATDSLPTAGSFFDFAEQSDAGEIANTDIDFWREKFLQQPPVMDLPFDKVRPPARTFQARRYDFELDKDIVALMPKAAAKLKASLVNLVMASYFALLYRLTNTNDLVVGLPVAGQAALKRLTQVGHMVQLLPIRLFVDPDMTFAELVRKAKTEVLNASEHPNFTFGKLLEKMVVDRSRVPLVCTIFNIDQPMNTLNFGEAEGSLRTVPRSAENFEMFLNVVPAPNKLTIEATYSTVLFSEATIIAWMQSLENIISAAIANADAKIADFELSKNVPDVLLQSNSTSIDIQNPDFLRAFRKKVKESPDKVAVISSDRQLKYQELDRLSDDIAAILSEKGVKDEDVVGICCQRSEKMLACVIAVFKLGAAYLPLDPEFPQDRLTYMLDDSSAVAVIEDGTAPKGVRDAKVKHFEIDKLDPGTTTNDPMKLPAEKPDRLAYLIYTSGSTGKPKGVRVHHRAMINFLESMAREPGCTADDRLLAVTTLSFDISVLELYLPLICGATTIIAIQEQIKDGEKLAEMIEKQKVTILQATPSTWRMLLSSQWGKHKDGVGKLKALCGGEPLPPDLVAELIVGVSELWNMYGPTETTVWSTCKRIRHTDPAITIGRPIANTQIYIADQKMKPLPICAPGELYIGGEGVTLGYHNREALNKERFIQHPEFGRIYRTGDLAKLLPSGEIQHMGRLDDQVKLRGYRIELGEIESALVACDGVKSAAVYLWQLSPDDVRIVACCVPESAGNFQSVLIRKKLREMLPGYMLPQYLLAVDEIPLTPNNKVNRRALPRPEISESTILSSSSLDSDTEKMVANIWSELIKPKNPIGREDNFFEIGGHSLLALEAIRKIENATGKRLTTAQIVSESLASIAEKISELSIKNNAAQTGPTTLSSAEIRTISPEQTRMLKRQLDYPGSVCNNLPAAWLLEGDLDLAVFSKSLERVYERQTALRTIIQVQDGSYRQVLKHVHDMVLLEFEDCSGTATPMGEAMKKANQLASEPFQALNSLLCRSKLFKIENNKHLFVFVPHQIIFDGWSFDVFLGELEATYRAFAENRSPSTNLLSFEFRDYAHWCFSRDINQEHLDYHLPSLEDVSKANFVKDMPNKGLCKRREFSFSGSILEKIEAFCGANKLRLHEFLFAAFGKALSDFVGMSRILIGMPVTGRYSPDVIGLIGSFVSVLPCEVSIGGFGSGTIVKNIAQQLREFHEHQDISYAEIVKGTAREQQLFPTYIPASFGFQDIRNRPTAMNNLKLSQIDMPRQQTELPIEFWIRIQPQGFIAVFDYDSALVESTVVGALGAGFSNLVQNIDTMVDKPNEVEAALNNQAPKKKPLWRRLFQ